MNSENQRLSVREKIGYSLGDSAANFYFQIYIVFLMYFYTDVFGISASIVGTMFLVSRIWDAVNDPMMGALADRTKSRWGKFRPWILFTSFPLAIFGVLAFTTPDLGTTAKILYAYVTYNFLMMFYTANNVPYSALMGVMTGDTDERTGLASWRFTFAMGAALVIQGLMLPLVGRFGGGDEAKGFMFAMLFFSSLALVFLLITFFSTKERIKPEPGQKTSIRQDVSDLVKNRPWLAMFITTIFVFIYWSIKGSVGLYYTKYFVNLESLRSFLNIFWLARSPDADVVKAGFTFYSVAGNVAMIIGILFTKPLAVRFGKKNVFRSCLFLAACSTVVFVFLAPAAVLWQFIFNILIQLFYGVTVPLLWAMIADVADFTEWKTHRRATAMTFAGILFALKLGLSLGGFVAGKLLTLYKYVPNVAQSASTLRGIRYMMSIIPAASFFIAVGVVFFYIIDKNMEHKIQEELTERRKKYEYT